MSLAEVPIIVISFGHMAFNVAILELAGVSAKNEVKRKSHSVRQVNGIDHQQTRTSSQSKLALEK